ncbi:MAG: NfeD family protein [Candidatus Bathyarchaeia archaeon]
MPSVSFSADSNRGVVTVITLDGVINVAAFDLVKEGFGDAQRKGANVIVLLLDTPGGLWDATRDIIKLVEQSSIPVVAFVYPRGATAWSAGTFILLSSHVAAMASHSIIGSCQPREYPSGELIDEEKLVNAFKGYLVEKARWHGRNETVAEEFVTKNRNLGAEDARDLEVIEVVASTIEDLLNEVDGMRVEVHGIGYVEIQTANAEAYHYGPSVRVQFLRIISDPMIAYLLFSLGVFGVIFGFFTAGYEGEILGGVLLILGLIGLGFHVDLLSIVLIAVGGFLVFVEMRDPGLQFFGPIGIVCLGAGTLLLLRFDPARWSISYEWYQLFTLMVVGLTAFLTVLSFFVLYKIIKAKKKQPTVLTIVGGVGKTVDEIGPEKVGFIRFHGEYWKARSNSTIKPNHQVKILAKEGPVLIVEPLEIE